MLTIDAHSAFPGVLDRTPLPTRLVAVRHDSSVLFLFFSFWKGFHPNAVISLLLVVFGT